MTKMIKIDDSHKIKKYNKVVNDNCPSFSGIVAGICKGNLWVDNMEDPNIAIAYSWAVGSFAFLGEIKSSEEYRNVEGFINTELFPMLKEKGIDYFEFSIENDNLKEQILRMFVNKEIEQEKEYSYRMSERIQELSLPEGYTLHKVDEQLWNLINEGNSIGNGSFLTERILESWESFDDFLKRSVAFCIMYSDKIVSLIVGTGNFNDNIAIDIETDELHRNKGLGFILTGKFVNECASRGMAAQWDCVESNPQSKKLAEKAKFQFLKQSEVYWFGI